MTTHNLWQPGQYEAEAITKVEFTETKNGSPQVKIDIRVEGHLKTIYLSLVGKAEQYTTDKLRSLGFNGDLENPEFTAQPPFRVSCKHDTYNGNTTERWDFAFSSKPMDPGKARHFASKFKAATSTPARPPTTPLSPPKSLAPAKPAAPARPAPSTTKVVDQDSAWAEYERRAEGKGGTSQDAWFKAIDTVVAAEGVAEANFTAEHWQSVLAAIPPF